jgi:hypothetical protein
VNILILTYFFIISKGFKDKTYGMPLIALCANISWEFIFSFILPSSTPQLFINYLWFGLDCVIVFQFFRYYKNEFPNLSSSKAFTAFGLLLFSAFIIILSGSILLGDHRRCCIWTNLLMSIIFVGMFLKEERDWGSVNFIAVFK